MTLYESWIKKAYEKDGKLVKKTWDEYLPLERKIYEKMIGAKDPKIEGTVAELAEKHNMPPEFICGFLDGIKEALTEPLDVEKIEESAIVSAEVDFSALYKKMVEYKAENLYNLPVWDNVFDAGERKKLYSEQKKSGTIVRTAAKIGRNDPCPCGSGKKYKHCCGAAV